jgi:hypothetical protein
MGVERCVRPAKSFFPFAALAAGGKCVPRARSGKCETMIILLPQCRHDKKHPAVQKCNFG